MKEIRKQKRKKRKSEPTGLNSAQPAHLARHPVRRILCAARSAGSTPDLPDFSFIFSIFQNLSPLKHKYLKIYNTFFQTRLFLHVPNSKP
jgi:hypothetical protein